MSQLLRSGAIDTLAPLPTPNPLSQASPPLPSPMQPVQWIQVFSGHVLFIHIHLILYRSGRIFACSEAPVGYMLFIEHEATLLREHSPEPGTQGQCPLLSKRGKPGFPPLNSDDLTCTDHCTNHCCLGHTSARN